MPVNSGPNATINTTLPNDKDPVDVVELIKCCCGKACKGVKGLKMHQRRCRVLGGLDENPLGREYSNSNSDTTSSLDSCHEIDQSEAASFISPENVNTKC